MILYKEDITDHSWEKGRRKEGGSLPSDAVFPIHF